MPGAKRVAIAGLGGVGGSYLLTLARLGVKKFNVAQPGQFERASLNRQTGATVSTRGRPKADVLAAQARDINPEAKINVFRQKIGEQNLSASFADVDLYIDGLDFFGFEAHALVVAHCAREGIPAVHVAPLGMGAEPMNFVPGGMTFAKHFQVAGRSELEKAVRFLVVLALPCSNRISWTVAA